VKNRKKIRKRQRGENREKHRRTKRKEMEKKNNRRGTKKTERSWSRSKDKEKKEEEPEEKHIEQNKKSHRPVKQLPSARPPHLEEKPPAPPSALLLGQPFPARLLHLLHFLVLLHPSFLHCSREQ
jgi:hypothetical protein